VKTFKIKYNYKLQPPLELESMSATKITAFHNMLREIVTVLVKRFPDDKHLEYTKSQIELSISVSPRGTITTFVKNTQPYLEQILRRDEQFFLCLADDSKTLDGLRINEKWISLTTSDRDRLWETVQKMVVLGNKIMKDEI
jgi:hypothetical protein